MNVGLLRNLYYNFKLTKSPWTQGVMVGAVTYGVRRPGFDPSKFQKFSGRNVSGIKWNRK